MKKIEEWFSDLPSNIGFTLVSLLVRVYKLATGENIIAELFSDLISVVLLRESCIGGVAEGVEAFSTINLN